MKKKNTDWNKSCSQKKKHHCKTTLRFAQNLKYMYFWIVLNLTGDK